MESIYQTLKQDEKITEVIENIISDVSKHEVSNEEKLNILTAMASKEINQIMEMLYNTNIYTLALDKFSDTIETDEIDSDIVSASKLLTKIIKQITENIANDDIHNLAQHFKSIMEKHGVTEDEDTINS